MMTPENAMTVVGVPNDRFASSYTMRVHADHYASAVGQLLDETAYDLMDDLDDDEAEDPLAVSDAETAARLAAEDYFKTVRVYAGHPPAGGDDVSKLRLIHEE